MNKTKQHIRFGVICNGTSLPLWQKKVLEKLVSQNDIDLKLVVCEVKQQGTKQAVSPLSGLWKHYYRHRIQKKSTALQACETDSLFLGVSKIQCDLSPSATGHVQLQEEHIEQIENAALDFIISFIPNQLPAKLFDIAKYGVWVYQFGDPEKYKINTPFFWEIYHQDVVTSAYLTRITNAPNIRSILHQGHLKTSLSYRKNMEKMLQECTSWPLKICKDIRHGTVEKIAASNKIQVQETNKNPRSLKTLLFPLIQLKQLLTKAWKQLFFTDYWNIGIVNSPIQEFLNPEKKHTVQWFPNLPKNRFMADPFGMYFKDQLHIVYEDLKFDDGIGKTASFLFDNQEFKHNEIVIDEAFHMSYPFLFEKDGEIYCVPETYQANQVRAYKALEFPSKWTLDKVLIEDYAGIDNTLIEHNGTQFLFSTDKNSGPHYNLNIHFADNVFGPWEAHPKNPVKTDIRSARPAGNLFEHNGELFRPSMDYSEKIEGRITINKIITLTARDFKEEAHTMVHPFENTIFSDKVHTLSKLGPYTLVDGAKELFILSNFSAFKYKMKRVLNKVKNN